MFYINIEHTRWLKYASSTFDLAFPSDLTFSYLILLYLSYLTLPVSNAEIVFFNKKCLGLCSTLLCLAMFCPALLYSYPYPMQNKLVKILHKITLTLCEFVKWTGGRAPLYVDCQMIVYHSVNNDRDITNGSWNKAAKLIYNTVGRCM